MTVIRLFIVDDHEMMRLGLREALAPETDIDIVGEAAAFDEALSALLATRPDVALLDVRLGTESGIHLCREVLAEAPEVRCLMYTSANGDEPLHESILAGASGFLLKDASRDELVSAIRRVASGYSLIDPSVMGGVLARLRERSRDPSAQLTDQESKVFELMGEGLSNREIAERLVLAEQTVKNYVSRVLTKLDMRRTQAALLSARKQATDTPPPR